MTRHPRITFRAALLSGLVALSLSGCAAATPAAGPTAISEPTAAAVVEPAPTVAPTAAPAAPAPALEVKDLYAVGDTAPLEPWRVQVMASQIATETELGPADEGNEFVLIDLALTNTAADAQSFSLLLQTTLEDATGVVYAIDPGASMSAIMSLNGTVDAAEEATGTIGFQVPAGSAGLRLVVRTLAEGATSETGRAVFDLDL
jgi:hypothetical protein